MQDSYLTTDKIGDTDHLFNGLSDDQIFSFLKRYYNDTYPTFDDGLKAKTEGIYFETIETLERLYLCLVVVSDFLGYAKIDWDDAYKAQKKIKIKEIVAFYNNLVIDVNLMKVGMKSYDFAPKVRAFINFVISEPQCLFRSDVQANLWTIEDFPHDQIFKTVDRFKKYFEKRKKIYHPTLNIPEWKEQVKEIEVTIKKSKRITQALYLIKFSVTDFSEDEIADLTSDINLDSAEPNLSSSRKLKEFVEWLSLRDIDVKLPWLCKWTKVEIYLRREVRITIGMILDATEQELPTKLIQNALINHITLALKGTWFEQLIVFEVVQLDQIFDHLGVGVIRYITLPNKRKLDLMLKWYLGVFYQLNTIIQPSNLEAETYFADKPVIRDIKERKLENTKFELCPREKSKTEGKSEISFELNSKKLIKQIPAYFSSIHFLYEGLKHCEGLNNNDIEKLQKLNLFIAYLGAKNLDSLQDTLKMTKPQKWADVVQIYLILLRDWNDSYLKISNLAVCEIDPLDRGFRRQPSIKYIKKLLMSEQSLKTIVRELRRLKRELLNQEKVKSLKSSTRLVEKNSRFAIKYLNHSFKQNLVLLRFKIDNRETSLELSELKNLFTQFIKSSGRAPKRIGAEIDAYIGYYIFDGEGYSIDFTAIFYLRDNISAQDVLEQFDDYWQEFKGKYAKAKQFKLSQLKLSLIPTLWAEGGNLDPLVINKGDKFIPQLKKDLVGFYTAYEYIRKCKNTQEQGGKRPELFLRGRIRKPIEKSEVDRQSQQSDTEVFQKERIRNNENSKAIVDNQKQDWDRIDEIKKERVRNALANLKPLTSTND